MKRHSIKTTIRTWTLGLACALVTIQSGTGQTVAYTAIDFPNATSTSAWGINDHGDVVGIYALADKINHGFLRHNGKLTAIDVPAATTTEAFGINSAGDIVGDFVMNGRTHGFVLSQGRFTTVDVPGAASTSLAAINADGTIVAAYNLADGSTHTSLISDDQFTSIDISTQTTTLGNGINAEGDVVGNQIANGITNGFIRSKGQLTVVSFAGATFTGAYGLDQSGNVVGRYRDIAGVTHGFIRVGSTFTTIDIPGASLTSAAAVNSLGDIVGRYTSGGINHAFLMSSPVLGYNVTDLGVLPGGAFSQGSFITDSGLIAGVADIPNGTQHSVLWQFGGATDIIPASLAGVNSGLFGMNAAGLADGQVETSTPDPLREDFCAYGTHRQCQAFIWRDGQFTILPTLGGNNSTVGNINKRGQVPGLAETAVQDRNCNAPQILQYKPVVWGPRQGAVKALSLLPGDTVGMAIWINDNGQSVGTAGTCGNTFLPPFAKGPHAVLWDAAGNPTDLGNLGGTVNLTTEGFGNIALAINNPGQAVGASTLKGNQIVHAFVWARESGMKDLGTLPGDTNSAATTVNDRGEIAGQSFGPMGSLEGNPRAFLWRNGSMMDLNALAPADSPVYMLLPSSINASGEIVGLGVTEQGDIHGFLATPRQGPPAASSSTRPSFHPVRKIILRNTGK